MLLFHCFYFDLFLFSNLEDQCSKILAELGLDGEDPPFLTGISPNKSWLI